MQINIPPKAKEIIEVIQRAGYEAYVVGGCVRDSILGRDPQDWDITTSALPLQVKALFPRTVDTGLKHGTVTVMIGKEGFEVTTYRIDGAYEDNRHPKEVQFTPSLEEDLKRRDFTINAMAYNDESGLVDLFGGMEDIENKVIRCVGDAKERFSEDALRIMRAIRFCAQLGYRIEEETKKAVALLAPNLKSISAERIQAELIKLVTSDHPEELKTAYETGVTKIILPEFDRCMETGQHHPHHMYSVGEHILVGLENVPKDKFLRLAMLFHDIGKPLCKTTDDNLIDHFYGHQAVSEKLTKDILKRLKFDNDTLHMVSKLVLYHDYCNGRQGDMKLMRRALNRIGEEAFPGLFDVMRADILAQSQYMREEKLAGLQEWEDCYQAVIDSNQCVSLKTLAVTGSDLIRMGMEPGKEIGAMLQSLLEHVLEVPADNDRDILLQRVRDTLS